MQAEAQTLSRPHGGRLVDLVVAPERAEELERLAGSWPARHLTERQRCDLELLASGAFSPLTSYLGASDLASVCERLRLADGTLWPMPIMLDIDEDTLRAAEACGHLALRGDDGNLLGVLEPREAWRVDPLMEARAVFGTDDTAHPSVDALVHRTEPWYVTGPLEVLPRAVTPPGRDHQDLRFTPAALRRHFTDLGVSRVVAFNTRNPMHRAHHELTVRAARETGAHLLVQPVVGPTKPGDIDVPTRVACYRGLMPSYPAGRATLALLPLAMRMGGPREALWHAIIRQNFGASFMIIGRDHAGPGQDSKGRPFYEPYASQELVRRHQDELEVRMASFPQLGYVEDTDSYEPVDQVPPGTRVRTVSGTEVRQRLARGEALPAWFTPPAVAAVLADRFPPLSAASA
ncbi:sulfate adenylyltransferase [Pedococcus sp. 2YAF34]|uniref:sulfate adenylyltransferase n=1 Tax=Pedococcus sp. 2YAF34 TaxID=3233032 RepID=UPI003F951B6C